MAAEISGALAVMDALEWGFNYARCPLCAGWNCSPNGETDHAHTADCPFPEARAAVAELISDLQVVAGTYADTDEGDWMASIVRAALARISGEGA